MNRAKNNRKSSIPQWQSEKMKILIVERWKEVWQVIEARQDRS